MKSLWSDTVEMPGFPALNGDVNTDVLIIGGGIAGVLCAHRLQAAGVPYVLAEGNRIGGGITKNTTAKVTSQHGLIYQKLVKHAGIEKARMYYEANQKALAEIRALCETADCDFEEKDATIYSLRDEAATVRELFALGRMGVEAESVSEVPLPFGIAGAVRFKQQGQFHPLKFLAGIAQGLNIKEQTTVRELVHNKATGTTTAVTASGRVTARAVIVASHFPFLNKHGGYFLKMVQHRSYAIAIEGAVDVDGMYLEAAEDGLSFRNHGDLLIIGGGDHKTGRRGGNWEVLRDLAKWVYHDSSERYAWATQDCMTLDGVPYIGRYGKSAQGLYVATGFNKWGMTSAMVSALILTEMVVGRESEYAEVFSPQRSMARPRLLVNGLAAMGNLLTPSLKRCPHMGCALKWNAVERSWDCPCHGSRFERDGRLIDNPATKSMDN